jgi:transcriptional regulator with XRE-family HTH domain
VSAWTIAERRLRNRFARNLRRLRISSKFTLEEAAGRARIHWRHWQKLEGGEVSPTLRTLARLAEALDVDPREFLA